MARRRQGAGSQGERELKLQLIAIGRCRDDRINSLCEEYLCRIGKHVSVELVEIEARDDRAIVEKISRRLDASTRVIVLDAGGRSFGSEAFARHLERTLSNHARVAFVVGDAGGLPAGIEGIAGEKLSLTQMTLPHRLARVLLAEQIYRAFTIIRGAPYHK